QLGPGLAVGDIDGSGSEALFVAGAAGQPAAVYAHRGNGEIEKTDQPALEVDKFSTGMGAVFFDARGTGALDLYVASGGVQGNQGDPTFRGKLYVNDGIGRYARAPEGTIPNTSESSGVVAAADFDHDGYVDLFI